MESSKVFNDIFALTASKVFPLNAVQKISNRLSLTTTFTIAKQQKSWQENIIKVDAG
jgi:hypothetical protein